VSGGATAAAIIALMVVALVGFNASLWRRLSTRTRRSADQPVQPRPGEE
jgi:hypothetical protein